MASIYSWLVLAALFASVAVTVLVPWDDLKIKHAVQEQAEEVDRHRYMFYNEYTGEAQVRDPGDIPFKDAEGQSWYIAGRRLPDGASVTSGEIHVSQHDPDVLNRIMTKEEAEGAGFLMSKINPRKDKYLWVEIYSQERDMSWYYNQETQQSQWEKPADLSWKRIEIRDED